MAISRSLRDAASDRVPTRAVWATILILILIILAFAANRVSVDWPNVAAGSVPPTGSFDHRYALHPALAYVHIVPGVVYLVGAPFQLSRRFRERHFTVHRRMGRVVLPAGITTGAFAIIFGTLFPFGGLLEASATVVFGVYFVTALVTAFLAIKGGDVTRHRRWMIRAFAVGLAVGTIRIWIGVFLGLGLLSFERGFGVAFWLAFTLHALAAEAYLTKRPSAHGTANPALTARPRLLDPTLAAARRLGRTRTRGDGPAHFWQRGGRGWLPILLQHLRHWLRRGLRRDVPARRAPRL